MYSLLFLAFCTYYYVELFFRINNLVRDKAYLKQTTKISRDQVQLLHYKEFVNTSTG